MAAYARALSLQNGRRRAPTTPPSRSGGASTTPSPGSIVVASALLMYRLLAHDFRVSYVTSYSGRDLPFRYLFSTFWAGQEGSFLLWLFWGALIGFFVWRTAKEQEPRS